MCIINNMYSHSHWRIHTQGTHSPSLVLNINAQHILLFGLVNEKTKSWLFTLSQQVNHKRCVYLLPYYQLIVTPHTKNITKRVYYTSRVLTVSERECKREGTRGKRDSEREQQNKQINNIYVYYISKMVFRVNPVPKKKTTNKQK